MCASFRLIVHPNEAEHLTQNKEERLKRIRKMIKRDIYLETDQLLAPSATVSSPLKTTSS